MDSLIFIITLIFLAAGIGYGLGAKTIKNSTDVITSITKTLAGPRGPGLHAAADRAVHRVLQLHQHADGRGGEDGRPLEERDIGAIWLLIGFIFITIALST